MAVTREEDESDTDGSGEAGSDTDGGGEGGSDTDRGQDETVRVWLVERTFSDDEQNIIVHVYATPDGTQYHREERAVTSFTGARDTTAAVDVAPRNLGQVDDPSTREQYATEAQRMRADHDPDDAI